MSNLVEVIRCKKCEYFISNDESHLSNNGICVRHDRWVCCSDFCSDAEKKQKRYFVKECDNTNTYYITKFELKMLCTKHKFNKYIVGISPVLSGIYKVRLNGTETHAIYSADNESWVDIEQQALDEIAWMPGSWCVR